MNLSYIILKEPIGENILSHSVTSIIYLRPGKAGSRVMKLVDSPDLPVGEANFYITKDGFVNDLPKEIKK